METVRLLKSWAAMGERARAEASSGRRVDMKMSLLLGVHAASLTDCEARSETVFWSTCWERLKRNARTCGTGAIVSVGESVYLNNDVGVSLDTIVLKCEW